MKKYVNNLFCLTVMLICAFVLRVAAQTPVVLFQDGFENDVPGEVPPTNSPVVGSYGFDGSPAGQPNTNTLVVLTGQSPFPGGPPSAEDGNNYLMYEGSQLLHALFGTGLFATNSPFHVSFYKWRPTTTGYPQIILGSGRAVSGQTQLAYTTDWPGTLMWRWYAGHGYQDTTLFFTTNHWDFCEMDFDGTNLTARINGGTNDTIGQYGGSDKVIDQVLFRSGGGPTYFYLDDIKVTTTAPTWVVSMQPAQGATGVSRQPLVEIQLGDGTQSVQVGTIHLFFNGTEVIPTVTQQTNSSGINVTTVAYMPPASLPYASTNTVTCTYSDNATPANQYSKSWTFTVYNADPIFADNFDASTQMPVGYNLGPAFEGTNCLAVNRFGSGRPFLNAAGDTNAASSVGDLITFDCAVRVDGGVLKINLGNTADLNTAGVIGHLNLFSDGRVSIVDPTGKVNQFLTQQLATNAWNTLEIQYTNGSTNWSASVNGAPFESMEGGLATNVNGFHLETASSGTVSWVDDLVLSNQTTGTVLFKDGLEAGIDNNPPATNTPVVGTYSTISPGTVPAGLFVANGLVGTNFVNIPPNAPQVGTYNTNATTAVVFTTTHHSGSQSLDLTNGQANMVFITPIPSGILVHAEAYINWQAGNVAWGFTTGGTNEFARVTLNDSYGITLFDGTNEVDSGFGHTTGVWEQYGLDYVVGAPNITLTLGTNSVTIPIAPQSSINGLFFVEDDALSSSAYVDDVLASARLGEIPATNPYLDVAQSGDQLILSWANAVGYVLQENTDLSNPSGWVNVPGGGVSPVQVPTSSAAVFYRLIKPN